MKHVLLNKDGQVHATIIGCPFKYTLPRALSVYEDNPAMGKLPVDTFCHTQPKCHEDTEMHAMDFAVVKDGVVQSIVVWGGAEWCPPTGTMIVPLDKWMGIGDNYNVDTQKFSISTDRKGKSDKDKSVAELNADMEAWKLSIEQ